jgi:hypothetical protein
MSTSRIGDRHVAAVKTTLPYDPRGHTLLRRRLSLAGWLEADMAVGPGRWGHRTRGTRKRQAAMLCICPACRFLASDKASLGGMVPLCRQILPSTSRASW